MLWQQCQDQWRLRLTARRDDNSIVTLLVDIAEPVVLVVEPPALPSVEDAERRYLQEMKFRSGVLGSSVHSSLLGSFTALLRLYQLWHGDGGDAKQTIKKAEAVFEDWRRTARDKLSSPDLCRMLHAMGAFEFAMGQLGAAHQLFLQVACTLDPQMECKGTMEERQLMVESMRSLGNVIRAQGQPDKAVQILERCVSASLDSFGPDDQRTAASQNDLAVLYQELKRYDEAAVLFERSVPALEKSLGPDHPHVSAAMNGLATLYMLQTQFDKALPVFLKAMQITERNLGLEHPQTAAMCNNLAGLYCAMTPPDFVKAQQLYDRCVSVQTKLLGEGHPHLADSLHNAANCLYNQHKAAAALPLLQRALKIRTAGFGAESPQVSELKSWIHTVEQTAAAQA